MNHKRGRPKNRRAGCLMCKPHKGNGTKARRSAQTLQERRAREAEEGARAEAADEAAHQESLRVEAEQMARIDADFLAMVEFEEAVDAELRGGRWCS